MKPKHTAVVLLVLLALIAAACNLPNRQVDPSALSEEDRVNTAAARTIAALATELAAGHQVTVGVPTRTATAAPGTSTETSVPQASSTSAATSSTNTPGAQITAADGTTVAGTNAPCNQASFVDDATIPDGSTILPNANFTKTWELKNTGSCTWSTSYAVVFAGRGSSMSGPAANPLSAEVKPGETALISVPLRAPGEFGTYSGYWQLRSGDGKTFGTGTNGTAPFYVEIRVAEEYSFAQHICSAKWSSGAGDLPCPGTAGDSKGYALPLENPTLENNQQEEGPGILAAAQPVAGGYITGQYEPVLVPPNSDFRATISCANGATNCYVRFKVTYKVGDGPEQLLGEWNEGYEGGVTQVIRDLDMVGNQAVSFIFTVTTAGDPNSGKGVWFFPRIVK